MFSNCFTGIFQPIHLLFLGSSRLGQIGNFSSGIGKKHTFCIGNGAEFGPQIEVIESPDLLQVKLVRVCLNYHSCHSERNALRILLMGSKARL